MMATNLRGVFFCMKYEIQQMLTQGAVIINNSSIAGLIGIPGMGPYTASKHAVMVSLVLLRSIMPSKDSD